MTATSDKSYSSWRAGLFGISVLLALVSCGGGSESDQQSSVGTSTNKSVILATQAKINATYSVGGTISGLVGSQLALTTNRGETLMPAVYATTFTFATQLSNNAAYDVTVSNQPLDQRCAVANGRGKINGASVTNIAVSCVTTAAMVSTIVGSGAVGSADGPAATASFNYPTGLARDTAGNLYVADQNNNKIRKVAPDGTVSTLAGSGLQGSADGIASAASFNRPYFVAVDGGGRVYVADTFNNTIRKVFPDGTVKTFAGSGAAGLVNGTGAAASFSLPVGVAVDTAGYVYVADQHNHTIRKISPTGDVTSLAGNGTAGSADGTGSAASFYYPAGIALDSAGNVYVADAYNQKIRKVTPSGVVTTLAGSGAIGSSDGTGSAASFYQPSNLAVDAGGNVYLADEFNHKIRKITPAGVVTTLAGTGTQGSADGTGSVATFAYPTAVVLDEAANVYVMDYFNQKIRKIFQLNY